MQAPSPKSNLYDRIFRENAESIFIPLIEEILGFKIISHTPLPEKLNKTIAREVDFLYRIKTDKVAECLLHIEFQTKNDRQMVYRIGEYHALILRKYKLPIQHVVIYLGKQTGKMPTSLSEGTVYHGFELINLYDLNTENLLASQVPEVILLAVLSHFSEKQTEPVLRLIVKRLKAVSESEAALAKYLNQLIILSKLRKFDELSTKIIQEMSITYDIEQDAFYRKGLRKGFAEGEVAGEANEKIKVVHKCYANGLSVALAVNLSGLPMEEVQNIYTELEQDAPS